MGDTSEALRRLMAQLGVNADVLVGGTPLHARRLLAEAADALAGHATVVPVACPIGELNLSTLIAQLSGRPDLDDQDDAVLELAFKRLMGESRTVLMVLAPAGICRSALRYLQHVSRRSPRLAMVVYGGPRLASTLDEPGFAALRARLHTFPVVEFEARAVLSPNVRRAPPISIVAVRRRRPVLWAASALGMAAIAGVIWHGRSAPGIAVAGGRTAHAKIPLETAAVPLPALAWSRDPVVTGSALPIAAALAPPPPLAASARSATAKLPPIVLATLPAPPPSMKMAAASVLPQFRASHAPQLDADRRVFSGLARARPPARYQQSAGSQEAQPWDEDAPMGTRRDPRRRDAPYRGTYAVDANGVRYFQYDR